ncbi:hypothetical protein GCM10022221_57600 [Actinocorallia aurea]
MRLKVVAVVCLVASLVLTSCDDGHDSGKPAPKPGGSVSALSTAGGKGGGGEQGKKGFIEWIKDIGLTTPATGKDPERVHDRAYALFKLAGDDCGEAVSAAAALAEPARTLYRGAGQACLAALHGETGLWAEAERAYTAESDEDLDCVDQGVFRLLRTLVEAHGADPEAHFVRADDNGGGGDALCPRVTGITPDHGTAGETVTITGVNLSGDVPVLWGSEVLVVAFADGTGTLTVPQHLEEGSVDVQAEELPGDIYLGEEEQVTFTYDDAPAEPPPTTDGPPAYEIPPDGVPDLDDPPTAEAS